MSAALFIAFGIIMLIIAFVVAHDRHYAPGRWLAGGCFLIAIGAFNTWSSVS